MSDDEPRAPVCRICGEEIPHRPQGRGRQRVFCAECQRLKHNDLKRRLYHHGRPTTGKRRERRGKKPAAPASPAWLNPDPTWLAK